MNYFRHYFGAAQIAAPAYLFFGLLLASPQSNALILTAPANGSFTMNLDRNALVPYAGGYYLSTFWNSAVSDSSNPLNTGDSLISQLNTTEIPANNQVFDLTVIGPNPSTQAGQRFVQGTSANFSIDSDTLAGKQGEQVGMTGVQGFYAPNWPPQGAGLVNGDFSVMYDTTRQTSGRTGWYLANNIYFSMAVYDFDRLTLSFTDAQNWQLRGDLLMSPENGGMLQGEVLKDVGDFCLGTGAYSGCGLISNVPELEITWLFGIGLIALLPYFKRSYVC